MFAAGVERVGNLAANALLDAYALEKLDHSETLIGAASALVAEFALRAVHASLPDVGWVESDGVDELLFDGKADDATTLWSIIAYNALQAGAAEFSLPDPVKIAANMRSARARPEYPALSVPEAHYPREWPLNAGPRMREHLARFQTHESLSEREMATAMAMAAGVFVRASAKAKSVRPHIAATLALEVMIGASRIVPLAEPVKGFRDWKNKLPQPADSNVDTGDMQTRDGESPVLRAVGRVSDMLMAVYRDRDGRFHHETVIGAAAALAGEYALRAVVPEIMLPDNGWVIAGDAINELIFEDLGRPGVKLWPILADAAIRADAPSNELPDPVQVVARTASKLGSSPFPPITVPDAHYPREWSPNACARFRERYGKIVFEEGLYKVDRALAPTYVAAVLIADANSPVPPAIGATLALEIMVGVSRMAPLQREIT